MKKLLIGLSVIVMAVADETIISAIVLCIALWSFIAILIRRVEDHHN